MYACTDRKVKEDNGVAGVNDVFTSAVCVRFCLV